MSRTLDKFDKCKNLFSKNVLEMSESNIPYPHPQLKNLLFRSQFGEITVLEVQLARGRG